MFTKSIRIAIPLGLAVVAFFLIFRLPGFHLAEFKPDPGKPNDRIRLENEIRTSYIQMLGGLLVLAGVVFGYINLRTLQEGQLTERFTRAIEQLGNNNFSIRLGGIFSLERIARESNRVHQAVMEILGAYARAHSNDPARREDIQAVMFVIGRRNVKHEKSSAAPGLNLAGANLTMLDLSGGNYEQMSFVGARFSAARLAGTRFNHADLSDCNFDTAYLKQAVFDNAKLNRASFSDASLFEAKLREADLSGAVLKGASLWRSDLTRTDFTGAKLGGSFLLQATLNRTIFRGADLSGAVISLEQLDSTIGELSKPPDSPPRGVRVTRTPDGQFGILHADQKTRVSRDSPVKPGEFLEVYCEGLGELRWPTASERTPYPRTVAEPKIKIDGEVVFIDYAGVAPGTPAGYQINLQVPPDLPPGKHSLKIVVHDLASEEVDIESAPLALTS